MRNWFNAIFQKRPMISAFILVAIGVLVPPLIAGVTGLDGNQIFGTSIRYVFSLSIIALLIYLGWGQLSGVTIQFRRWRLKWVLLTVPFILMGMLNFTSTDWSSITITSGAMANWLVNNFAIGLYEEVLMRGLILYILFRAWGKTRSGLYNAVIVQAVIFGLLHYFNLTSGASFEATTVQVIYATLIGIGFGGLALLTRSIWPGVIAHSFVNSVSSLNEFFGPSGSMPSVPVEEMTLGNSLVAIVLIFILAALPGFFYARRAKLQE